MRWKKLLKVAVRSIMKNRMRSLLTSLGIIIGVAAVIVMVAVGQGSQARIESQINALGANMIIVFPARSFHGGVRGSAGSFNRMTLDDAEKIAEEATMISAVSPVVRSGGQVIGGDNNWNTSIEGVQPSYLQIRDWDLASGEFFTDRDVRERAKVAVLGKTVADSLFPGQDPVGAKIRVRNTPFEVIGILAEKGQNAMGQNQDDIIMAPSTTVLYRLKGRENIDMIVASAASADWMSAAQEELTELLREAHGIQEGEDDDFIIRNQAEIIEAASETSRIMTLLLGSIAGVSLIVGGIGIMNIMLVSVTERTREIGIRLAIGARGSDVLAQFLTEAVVLSLVGGLVGILVAGGATFILNEFTEIVAVINPLIVFLAVAFSGGVGVFFGFYPARKAAALNPIDALHYE